MFSAGKEGRKEGERETAVILSPTWGLVPGRRRRLHRIWCHRNGMQAAQCRGVMAVMVPAGYALSPVCGLLALSGAFLLIPCHMHVCMTGWGRRDRTRLTTAWVIRGTRQPRALRPTPSPSTCQTTFTGSAANSSTRQVTARRCARRRPARALLRISRRSF